MGKFSTAFAASLAIASPAFANEARIEVRGGEYLETGFSQEAAGFALGYDFDLSDDVFVGGEISADKVLQGYGTRLAYGFSGRLGIKVSPKDRLFINGGGTTKFCGLCVSSKHVGGGYERMIGSNLYSKVEYRRFFYEVAIPDGNLISVGVGFKF